MADILWPINRGSTVTWGVTDKSRDFIGIEDPGGATARGYNEIVAWTKRYEQALLVNHFSNGVHNYLGIPRAVLQLLWDNSNFSIGDKSYVQDTSGVIIRGAGAASVLAHAATGSVSVQLASAMVNTAYRIQSITPSSQNDGVTRQAYFAYVSGIASTVAFTLQLFQRSSTLTTAGNTVTPKDFSFAVAVFDS